MNVNTVCQDKCCILLSTIIESHYVSSDTAHGASYYLGSTRSRVDIRAIFNGCFLWMLHNARCETFPDTAKSGQRLSARQCWSKAWSGSTDVSCTKLCHENSTSCADLTEPRFWRGVDERRPPAMQQWEGRLCHAGSSKTPQLQHAFEQVLTPAG